MTIFKSILLSLLVFVTSTFGENLRVGILPYTDTLKILKIYQPFKQFFESKLQQKVEIYTANSYEKFFEDTKNGQFDLIITGPHFGLIHIQDGFTPLYRYNTQLEPIFVVLKDSPYTQVKDLKNKKISMSNHLSVSSIGGIKALLDEGFKNNIDFKLINSNSHTSAIKSVILGDTDAAITTHTPIKQLTNESIKNQIRIFSSGFSMPHLFTIANPKLSKEKVNTLQNTLREFEQSTTGQEFLNKTGYKGYIKISQQDLDAMSPVLEETKGFLKIK